MTGKVISVYLVVVTICAVNLASGTPERRERHVSSEDSTSQRLEATNSSAYSNKKLLSHGNNELTTEPRRKVTQRLIGGHIKAESKTDPSVTHADDDDEASWDDGLIRSSAGNGKEKNNRQDDDDEKKTLSQQVKEGKYGLIQNEIYPAKPKRPGIISYLPNPEVPKDNAKNLGGLEKDEIWLSEDRMLVIRGGNFPDYEADRSNDGDRNDWPPIDDYNAPKRQVKIPSRPKVPPPFPVQLSDNGPVQIIGVNGTSHLDESSNDDESDATYNKGFLSGEGPLVSISQNGTIASQDLTSQENATKKVIDQDRKTKSGHVPPPTGVIGPFYPALPPGAVFVVPPGNFSDYDEDDQSIYYPPPYSFQYKQDNSTPVPPGPLVPGIILPPPPDFFAGLDEKKSTKSTTKAEHIKYTKRPSTTPLPKVSPTYYPPRKSSTKPYKSSTSSSRSSTVSTTKQTSQGTFAVKSANRLKYKTTTERSTGKTIRVEENTLPFVEVTTPAVNKASTLEISEFYTARPNTFVSQDAEKSTTRTKNRWHQNVSSKPVPLVTYYASSSPSTVDEPVEDTPASIKNIISTGSQRGTSNQASYYFYEEANDDDTGTTPNPTIYYRTTTEAPYYRVEEIPQQREQRKKSYYDVQATPTQETPKDYNVELLEPIPKTSSRYQYTNSAPTTNSIGSTRAQGQRMLANSSPLYYDSITERPTHLKPYYTTRKPKSFLREPQDGNRYDYDQGIKPKPIYQYSFEAANYFKRGQQQQFYKPESQRQSYYKQDVEQTTQSPQPFDEWQDIREDSHQYDYDGTETVPEQQIQPERENHHYRNQLPISYPTSTNRPIIDTTPNPQHAYYTKQDEQLLDDVTREYFTNFGMKLRGERLPNTTPIYGKTSSVTERPDYPEVNSYVSNDYDNGRQTATYEPPRVRVHYGHQTQRPYSLEDDTQVNYEDPLPESNPDSEWIPGFDPKQQVNVPLQSYRTQQTQLENQDYVQQNLAGQRLIPTRGYSRQRIVQHTNGSPTNFVGLGDSRENGRQNYPSRPISLEGDIAVNYRNPRPPINPDAEFINSGTIRENNPNKASYFAYRLPGDKGHFYFLTPQAVNQRQDGNGGYLYPRPRSPRLSRRRKRGPGNP